MWPDDQDLPLEVHAAFGANPADSPGSWSWTDLSSRLQPELIRLRAGKSAGAISVSPGTCTVTLDNDDGALTPKHPLSTYWPNVRRGTPLRVRVFWGGVWNIRFSGFADQWEPEFLTTTTPGQASSRVRLTASGLLRRLEQGGRPLFSAPRRYIPTTSPVAYWSLEDGRLVGEGTASVGAQSMRPYIGAHPAGNVVSAPRWGRGDLAPWLPETLSRTGSAGLTAIWAPVTMPATPGRWVIDFMYRSGTDAGISTVDVNPSYLPGGALGWPQLYLDPAFREVLVAMNGAPEVSGSAPTLFDDLPHHVRWDVYQNAAKVSWNVYVDGVMVNFGTTSANMTLPSMGSLAFTADAQNGASLAQGHIAVWVTPPVLATAVTAAFAHSGETAAARVTRLCAEESVAVTVASGESEALGPQTPATLVDLLREAENADSGLLYESGFGLAYRPRGARYNAPVAMTVDLAQYLVARGGARDVLAPVYDDQALRNEWTVSRPDGGTATAVDLSHQSQVGVYEDSAELNLPSDGRLLDHAWWRVYLGTVDELRERGGFPLDLAANPGLLTAWLSCQVGTRVVRINPPAQYQPGGLDRLVDGWTETIGPRSWAVQVTPSPAVPWDVATVDGQRRISGSGSQISGNSLSNAGSSFWLKSTHTDGPWTMDAADFPLPMRVGGERVTAGVGVTDLFDRTVSGGWGGLWSVALGAASAFSVASDRGVVALSGTGRFGATLDLGSTEQECLISIRSPVTATGGSIVVGWMARYVDTDNHLYVEAEFRTTGRIWVGLYARIGGSNSTLAAPVDAVAYTAGTTYRLGVRAVGDSFQARVYPGGTPPTYQVSAAAPATVTGTRAGARALLAAGNSNTQPVAVTVDNLEVSGSGIKPLLVDAFTRTVASSWGSAPGLSAWATSGGSASDYSTNGFSGAQSLGTVNVLRTSLLDIGITEATVMCDVIIPVVPTGAPITHWLVARAEDLNNHYICRLDVATSNVVSLSLLKRVGGTLTTIVGSVAVGNHSGGTTWRILFDVRNVTTEAQLRARAWRPASDTEPTVWQVAGGDSGALMTGVGTKVGVMSRLESGNTSTLPVAIRWDNVQVVNPQVVTLAARAVNGVQRAWPAGSEVAVWEPAYAAL